VEEADAGDTPEVTRLKTMWPLLLAALHPLVAPADKGLFESAGLYLVRVTAVEVPDHPKLYGPTKLRIDEVLIGPQKLKGAAATYKFFTPAANVHFGGGARYSGKYPDFAYPTPKGQSRYWWASPAPKGHGWVTANFQKLGRFLPPPGPELLLKADLKPGSKEAAQQDELIKAVVRLESKRTLIEQIAVLREMQRSPTVAVYSAADRILERLPSPAVEKKK
jgi:hypothetical protein